MAKPNQAVSQQENVSAFDAAINAELAAQGMNQEEINAFLSANDKEGVEANILPKSGVFEFRPKDHISGTGAMRHLRIGVKGNDVSTSIGGLKIVAPMADEPIEFREITREDSDRKGTSYLVGTALNKHFSKYSKKQLAEYLDGKAFTAEEVKVRQLPYSEDGWSKPTEADTVVKTAYRITLK